MKKSVIILLLLSMLVAITSCTVKIGPIKTDTTVSEYKITDEDILDFLKVSNVISNGDVYKKYDRDIGLFGAEGPKRYVYQREDSSYYFIEINPISYRSGGEYAGYNYKPNELFYSVRIQDCLYNEAAESMDVRITERLGDITAYIVSGGKSDFKLNEATFD